MRVVYTHDHHARRTHQSTATEGLDEVHMQYARDACARVRTYISIAIIMINH